MKSHRWGSEPSTSLITKRPPQRRVFVSCSEFEAKDPPSDVIQMQRGAETSSSPVSTFVKKFQNHPATLCCPNISSPEHRRNHRASRLLDKPDIHFRLFNPRQVVPLVSHHFSSCPKACSSSSSNCHYHFGSAWGCAGDGTIPQGYHCLEVWWVES
jgi:hypothetical protein